MGLFPLRTPSSSFLWNPLEMREALQRRKFSCSELTEPFLFPEEEGRRALPPLLEHSQAEQDLRKTGTSCVFRSRSREAVSECSRGWFLPKPPTRPLTIHFLPIHTSSSLERQCGLLEGSPARESGAPLQPTLGSAFPSLGLSLPVCAIRELDEMMPRVSSRAGGSPVCEGLRCCLACKGFHMPNRGTYGVWASHLSQLTTFSSFCNFLMQLGPSRHCCSQERGGLVPILGEGGFQGMKDAFVCIANQRFNPKENQASQGKKVDSVCVLKHTAGARFPLEG